jgi:hypothetical protein
MSSVLSRREVLSGAAAAALALTGCGRLLDQLAGRCPAGSDDAGIDWLPDAAHPVSWGAEHVPEAAGVHRAMMIFYPSIGSRGPVVGSQTAMAVGPIGQPPPMLKMCGVRWPVVLFLHGHAPLNFPFPTSDLYRFWRHLPASLARSGYIVVVPSHPADLSFSQQVVDDALRDLDWVRQGWAHSPWVSKSPQFAIAGHSNGAMLGMYIAANTQSVSFVSLGGEYTARVEFFAPIFRDLLVPRFFMWADAQTSEHFLAFDDLRPTGSRYFVEYAGRHWDYIDSAFTGSLVRGPCAQMPDIAADLATLFIGLTFSGLTKVPIDLSKPIVSLTPKQQAYAFQHLRSLDLIQSGCSINLSWTMGEDMGSRHLGT